MSISLLSPIFNWPDAFFVKKIASLIFRPDRSLAADKAYEFLFVLGVPKITGAVQGIINPVAIR